MTGAVAVAGISGTGTPAHLRERLAVTPENAGGLSRSLAASGGEAVVLTTCNRTEVYLAAMDAAEARNSARRALAALGGEQAAIYDYGDQEAAVHLFRVASGLDSIVLGDTHVAGQVRHAHHCARAAGATGPLLNRLFEAASAASKRVRSHTALSHGPTSIPAAAIAVAARLAWPLSDRRTLIVGAGRIAKVAARGVAWRGCQEIVIASRSLAPAQELALEVSGRAAALSELDAELAAADVVISATGSRDFVLTAENAATARDRRGGRELVIFDLAFPRDVDPAFGGLPGSELVTLDGLAGTVLASRTTRRGERERAEAIVRAEAGRYDAWRRARVAAPAIVALHDGAEQARRQVLARHTAELTRLMPAQRDLVERITTQLVAQLVHEPTLELKRDSYEQAA